MKLISNTFFGKQLTEKYLNGFNNLTYYQRIRSNYDNFLSQPLELWMFVPCDENGSVLEEPKEEQLCSYCPLESWKSNSKGDSCEGSKCDVASENYEDKYQQAKERVLFDVYLAYIHSDDSGLFVQHELFGDGFYITADGETTIEYLLEFTKTLELTPNAIKQLGL